MRTGQRLLRPPHWRWWLGGAVALILCVTVIGPYVFLHLVEGPAPRPLSLSTPRESPTSSSGSTVPISSGVYQVAANSVVEYRVAEILFGQSATAVGKTSTVSGSMTLDDATVTGAKFIVALATVKSNESLRDVQFRGRIMDVAQYPDAVFTLTAPIALGTLPAVGTVVSVAATGDLIMHGVTRSVTFAIHAEYTGTEIEVSGSIPITFANWDIQNPSGGPAQVGNSGAMDFLLYLSHP
ncbi:MAG: YceI family protein [Candidatus Dormiibacterota bacterium]